MACPLEAVTLPRCGAPARPGIGDGHGFPLFRGRHGCSLYRPHAQASPGGSDRDPRTKTNLNPVGRTFYGLSTVICTPGSLDQEVGLGLGAQAGERRLGEVLHEAGFSRVRRATQTPFNLILEARP